MTVAAETYVIGCDVGSQSTVAALYADDGRCVTTARRSYEVSLPHPGWAEQSPMTWVRAVHDVVRQVAAAAPASAQAIRGVGIAAQLDGLVVCGSDLTPLRPAIIWMDRRAAPQVAALRESISEGEFSAAVGANLDSSHAIFKAMWVRDEEPAVYSRAEWLLSPGVFVLHAISGVLVSDYSNASSFAALDPHRLTWSSRVLEAAGLDPRLLPPLAPATQAAGVVTESFAASTGLPTSAIAAVGCGDEMAGTLGAGVDGVGEVCDIVGTAEPVCTVIDEPRIDAMLRLECHPHAVPGRWLLENPGFVSGGNLRWWQDEFRGSGAGTAVGYSDALHEAETIPAGAAGVTFLPCMQGATTPRWNADARGVLFGLTLAHTRAHITRAILESSAFALRDVLGAMANLGVSPRRLTVVGGGGQADLWSQIRADVTGLPVRVPTTVETTALGAAVLAAVASGTWPTAREAVDAMVRYRPDEISPDEATRATYDDAYARYRNVYFAVEPLFGSPSG